MFWIPGLHLGFGHWLHWAGPMKMLWKKRVGLFLSNLYLVTGPDIIFFWVARMIMAGLEFKEDPTSQTS